MTNASIYGIWTHEMADRGSSHAVMIQTIRDDGTYHTHMIFPFGGGCEQHIHHHGTIEIGEVTLTLTFERGETRMTGCTDPSQNFDMRGFTEAEIDEARSLLAQEIPYSLEGDALMMTVRGPMGEMKVMYHRQGK
jgi:hypothetical protein